MERAALFGVQNRGLLPPLTRATFRHGWQALYRNLTIVDTRGILFSLDRVVLETLQSLRDAALRLAQAHVHALCKWNGEADDMPKLHPIVTPLVIIDSVSEPPHIKIRLTPQFEQVLQTAHAKAHPIA